jgi:hypothetical protein
MSLTEHGIAWIIFAAQGIWDQPKMLESTALNINAARQRDMHGRT